MAGKEEWNLARVDPNSSRGRAAGAEVLCGGGSSGWTVDGDFGARVLLLLRLSMWGCDGSIGNGRSGTSAVSCSFSWSLRVLAVMGGGCMGLFWVSAERISNAKELPVCAFALALRLRRGHVDTTSFSLVVLPLPP